MARKTAKFFGVVLIILGIVGFFWDPILGIFEVDAAHNMVHVLLGALLLNYAKKGNASKGLKLVALIAFVVAILGFLAKDGMILGVIETNGASDWLHLVVAVILFALSKGKKQMMQNTMSSGM